MVDVLIMSWGQILSVYWGPNQEVDVLIIFRGPNLDVIMPIVSLGPDYQIRR